MFLHAINHETQTADKCTFCERRLELGRGGAPGSAGAHRAGVTGFGVKQGSSAYRVSADSSCFDSDCRGRCILRRAEAGMRSRRRRNFLSLGHDDGGASSAGSGVGSRCSAAKLALRPRCRNIRRSVCEGWPLGSTKPPQRVQGRRKIRSKVPATHNHQALTTLFL